MYTSFYNLTARPFQLSTDPRYFFGSRGHKRALSYLQYGITQGEGFIVITGDIGTGKTMLVQTLFSELDKENIVAAQMVTTQLEADDTLRIAAAAFGLAHEGLSKASLLKNLETFLIARTREGKRVLLVVDEAQNLPIKSLEELRMLSNFQTGGRALLQSFLLGQQQFRKTMESDKLEQLRQRVIAAYHLSPIDRDEIQGYIEHRLNLVGWQGDPVFASTAYDAIHDCTEGVPRRINALCDRLMLFGFLEELHEFDGVVVKTVYKELSEEMYTSPDKTAQSNVVRAKPAVTGSGVKPDKPCSTEVVANPQSGKITTSEAGNKEKAAMTNRQPEGVEGRMTALEQRVAELEDSFRQRQDLLRRVLLADGSQEES